MTTFEKLRKLEEDTAMVLSCDEFEEFQTLSAHPVVKMVPRGLWRADVTFYLNTKGGVLYHEALFTDSDFEALVEKIWKMHETIYQGVVE